MFTIDDVLKVLNEAEIHSEKKFQLSEVEEIQWKRKGENGSPDVVLAYITICPTGFSNFLVFHYEEIEALADLLKIEMEANTEESSILDVFKFKMMEFTLECSRTNSSGEKNYLNIGANFTIFNQELYVLIEEQNFKRMFRKMMMRKQED